MSIASIDSLVIFQALIQPGSYVSASDAIFTWSTRQKVTEGKQRIGLGLSKTGGWDLAFPNSRSKVWSPLDPLIFKHGSPEMSNLFLFFVCVFLLCCKVGLQEGIHVLWRSPSSLVAAHPIVYGTVPDRSPLFVAPMGCSMLFSTEAVSPQVFFFGRLICWGCTHQGSRCW